MLFRNPPRLIEKAQAGVWLISGFFKLALTRSAGGRLEFYPFEAIMFRTSGQKFHRVK
jgi:hypothetical protein